MTDDLTMVAQMNMINRIPIDWLWLWLWLGHDIAPPQSSETSFRTEARGAE